LHANKFHSLEELHKFLENYNISRLNQEETENLNILVAEIEVQIQNFQSPQPCGFTD
jgi:hypothetical protein